MKFYLTLFSLISFAVHGQRIETIKQDLSMIKTIQQAKKYLTSHSSISGQLVELNSRTDTTELDKELISTSPGNLIDFGSKDKKQHFFFKILESAPIKSFRVQYIFLDNAKLPITQIDSLRKVILKRIDKGESFSQLAKEYSMDGNSKKGGDLGWFFEGMMKSEFEESIKNKKTGEIFTVDIPSEKWYYVVKNSHDPRIDRKVTVLYIEISSVD